MTTLSSTEQFVRDQHGPEAARELAAWLERCLLTVGYGRTLAALRRAVLQRFGDAPFDGAEKET